MIEIFLSNIYFYFILEEKIESYIGDILRISRLLPAVNQIARKSSQPHK